MAMEKRNTVEVGRTKCVRRGHTGHDCQCPDCTAKSTKSAEQTKARGIRDTDAFAKEF